MEKDLEKLIDAVKQFKIAEQAYQSANVSSVVLYDKAAERALKNKSKALRNLYLTHIEIERRQVCVFNHAKCGDCVKCEYCGKEWLKANLIYTDADHISSSECHCKPRREGDLWIHNSFDGREAFELQEVGNAD